MTSPTTAPPRPSRRRAVGVAALALLLSACASGAPAAQEAAAPAGDGFPRTVRTDLGEVTVAARPMRIVAASTNAAEIALALAGPDRVAAVPDYNLEDRHSPYAAEARQVEATVAGIGSDPEQLLALDPDLVLITLAHGSEVDALELLQQAGVPTVALSRHPEDLDDVVEDVTLIGAALGEEEAAAEHVADIRERVDAVRAAVAGAPAGDPPRVAFISLWTDTGPYVAGPGTLNHDLLEIAGARNAMEDIGFTESGYLDPEQLAAAAPTHIVTRDAAGLGLAEVSGGFFDGAGLSGVPAIAEDRILVLPPGAFAASTAGVEGLEAMARWLRDPAAATEVR